MNTKPNFVFIMTDTQGANVVGTYGHSELKTPNIDRLAEKGIKFTNECLKTIAKYTRKTNL